MSFEQYVILIVSFIFSYVLMFYVRKLISHYKFFKPFLEHLAFDETSAKKFNELFDADDSKKDEKMHLIPYLKFFQDQTIHVTTQNKLYLDKEKYKKRIRQDLLVFFTISIVLITILGITLYFN